MCFRNTCAAFKLLKLQIVFLIKYSYSVPLRVGVKMRNQGYKVDETINENIGT